MFKKAQEKVDQLRKTKVHLIDGQKKTQEEDSLNSNTI